MRRRDFLDAPGSATKALLAIWVYRTVVVVFLIASFGCATTLAAEPKRVMLLHSLGPQFGPWSAYAKAIRNELRRQAQGPLDISDHSLVSARDRDETAEIAFVEYLRAIYTRQPLDLIITLGAPARLCPAAASAVVSRHALRVYSAGTASHSVLRSDRE
jgi:hypothetical protein